MTDLSELLHPEPELVAQLREGVEAIKAANREAAARKRQRQDELSEAA